MGFFAKFKEAFAASQRAQFLGDDGSLVVLHGDYIERIWGRSAATLTEAETAGAENGLPQEIRGDAPDDADVTQNHSSQRSEMWDLESVEAALNLNADALIIGSEKFQWEIPVGAAPRLANEAALFVNRVNAASRGPNYSLDTFVHPREGSPRKNPEK